jgi:hypothetical protein
MKVDGATTNILIAIALALGDPLLRLLRLAVGPDREESRSSWPAARSRP